MQIPKSHGAALESLAQAARSDRLVLFLGSGVSKPYQLPGWVELAKELGNQNPDLRDLPAEFSKFAASQGMLALNNVLERRLGLQPAKIHYVTELLLETRAAALVTTNCDRILETASKQLGAPIRVFIDDADLPEFHTTPWLRLIKLAGSLDRKETLVFTREQYANTRTRIPGLRGKVAELIRYCKVLVLGYSMADPDFADLVSLVSPGQPGRVEQMVGIFSKQEIDEGWRKLYLDEAVRHNIPLLEIPYEDFDANRNVATRKFLDALHELICPRALPSLAEQCVMFTFGYTATLKTELTSYLANCLGIPLLATHRYGRCTKPTGVLDPNLRQGRYKSMLDDASGLIQRGQSVILDGTFAEPHWRRAVYETARAAKARVIVLRTTCEDEAYIQARLWRRKLDHSRSEHEVTKFRNYEITRRAVQQHPLEVDEPVKEGLVQIIDFRTDGARSVAVVTNGGKDTQTLAFLIRLSPMMSHHV